MPIYRINSADCCVDGFERLRSQSEFILLAYPDREATADSILAELVADLDSCDRPDGFGYEAAERALRGWHASGGAEWIEAHLRGLEWPSEEQEEGAGLAIRLYLEERPAWRVSYEVTTQESAEQGDAESRGFVMPGEWRTDIEEALKAESLFDMTLREAVALLGAPLEDCGNGRDMREMDGRQNYATGAEELRTLHAPENITAASFARVYRLLGFRR